MEEDTITITLDRRQAYAVIVAIKLSLPYSEDKPALLSLLEQMLPLVSEQAARERERIYDWLGGKLERATSTAGEYEYPDASMTEPETVQFRNQTTY